MFLPKTPFSKSNHFGIAVNDNSVRVITVNSQGVFQSQEETLFDQPVISGDDIDKDNLVSALKNILDNLGTEQKYAAVCIPEKYAYSRVHTFPDLTLKEVDEAISWQLEKIFPFSKEEVYFDWKLISQDNKNVTALVTVISRQLLDHFKDMLQSAGVFPISFEPSASALTRLVQSNKKAQIIVELNSHSTSATLVVNQISSLTTTTIFNHQSSPDKVLQQITSSIQSLIDYCRSHHPKSSSIKLILTGEKATDQLVSIFAQSLSLEVELLVIDNIEPKYHTAYIAAKTNILPPSSNQSINLLPTSLQTYYQAHSDYTLAKSVIKYVIAFSIVTLILTTGIFGGMHIIVNRTNAKKIQLEQQTPTNKTSEFDLAKVNRKANDIVQLFDLKKSPENDIEEIIAAIPENVVVTNMQINTATKQFTLIGKAQTRDDLLLLKSNLESMDKFSKINIPLATLEIQDNINFNISFSKNPNK